MNVAPPNSPIVIYVNGASYGQPAPDPSVPSSRALVGEIAGYDPHAVAKEFPERWAGYIRELYTDPIHVQHIFRVSERTAYRWWKGEGGAKGSHVAIAVREHPAEAPLMLFAAE